MMWVGIGLAAMGGAALVVGFGLCRVAGRTSPRPALRCRLTGEPEQAFLPGPPAPRPGRRALYRVPRRRAEIRGNRPVDDLGRDDDLLSAVETRLLAATLAELVTETPAADGDDPVAQALVARGRRALAEYDRTGTLPWRQR